MKPGTRYLLGVHVTGDTGGADGGDDAVFHGEGALYELPFGKDLRVSDDHGLHLRQRGGSGALAHPAGLLVGQGGEDLAVALGILVGQHTLGFLQNESPPLPDMTRPSSSTCLQ